MAIIAKLTTSDTTVIVVSLVNGIGIFSTPAIRFFLLCAGLEGKIFLDEKIGGAES